MKANVINRAESLPKSGEHHTSPIKVKKVSSKILLFYRKDQILARYMFHPFLTKEGHLWGSFKGLHLLNTKTLEEVITLYGYYCQKQIGKEVKEVFPGFAHPKVKTIQGFTTEFWKGADDRIRAIVKSCVLARRRIVV